MAVRRSRRQSTAPKTYDPDAEASRPQFASAAVLETIDAPEPTKKAAPKRSAKRSAKKSPSPAPKSRSPSPAASPSPKRKSRSPSPAAPSPQKEEQKVEEAAIEGADAEEPAWQRILLLIVLAIVVYYGASPRAPA
jgi:hypothetical protein